MTGWGCWRKKY